MRKNLASTMLDILIVLGFIYIVNSFLTDINLGYKYMPYNVPLFYIGETQGASMLNNPEKHTVIGVVTKKHKYDTGDIVVAKREDKLILKRIAGIPGDKITLNDGNLYINDELYSYGEGNGNAKYKYDYELILNDDEYFLIGDNYNNSLDSRVTGPYKHKDIYFKEDLFVK